MIVRLCLCPYVSVSTCVCVHLSVSTCICVSQCQCLRSSVCFCSKHKECSVYLRGLLPFGYFAILLFPYCTSLSSIFHLCVVWSCTIALCDMTLMSVCQSVLECRTKSPPRCSYDSLISPHSLGSEC